MKDVFEKYLLLLRQGRDDKTEHSDRGALETLLNAAAHEVDPGIRIIHEAKKVRGSGAPDFKIMKAAMILGYVENKTVGENLDQILKSDQIKRYKALSNNILLTDYLHFIWIKDGKVNRRELIAFPDELEGKPKRPREDRVKAVSDLLRGFFFTAPEGIAESQKLALALATRSHFLRDFLDRELRRQEKQHTEGRLYGLFQVFRDQVFHELALGQFADVFAQMLTYGLFLAKLNSNGEVITLANARQFVPGSFRLIRELVQFLDDLAAPEYTEIRWVVEELLSIVNGLDLRAIHEDLSFKHRKAISRKARAQDVEEHRLFERDPFIYFYEDFLAKYDAKMKKARGVYYTPPPIVNFIVRAIDDILKENFGILDGLADPRVTVLDFACGTGTFMLEVFQRIFDNIGGPDAGRAGPIVREHLLENIFDFEYLIAPYTIAHLKLSQYLADKGHALIDGERLQVFLTNTLEPMEAQRHLLLPALSDETKRAQAIKEKPILVITGNPPYRGHSKNKGAWITASIEQYRKGFPELSKPGQGKWLQDDYVKFIRFAQMKMDGGVFKVEDEKRQLREVHFEGVDEGVVGIITNHSWLDNPTFRGMRNSLMNSFDQIYVLDLHGSAKKKERAPDGSGDKNVFDRIAQGVAISLFVKKIGLQRGIFHSDLWGSRLSKYQAAAEATKEEVEWRFLQPAPPDFLFVPQDNALAKKYQTLWSIPQIFAPSGDPAPCLVTTHDQFAISFSPNESFSKVQVLLSTNNESDARRLFRLCSQGQWDYQRAKAALAVLNLRNLKVAVTYRPFDKRWTIWNSHVAVHRRERVMHHMMHDNVGLLTCRQIASGHWEHVFAAECAADDCVISNRTKERGYLFPLYLYPPPDGARLPKTGLSGNQDPFAGKSRIENIAPDFRNWLDEKYEHYSRPRNCSATSTPFSTRRHTAPYTPSSCVSTFRVCRSLSRRTISKRCRGAAGRWCRRTSCTSYRGKNWPSITARAATWSRRCAIRPSNRRSRSTRRKFSSRCRKLCGISTSAAIRCSTNI
jgi:hypothetical protein